MAARPPLPVASGVGGPASLLPLAAGGAWTAPPPPAPSAVRPSTAPAAGRGGAAARGGVAPAAAGGRGARLCFPHLECAPPGSSSGGGSCGDEAELELGHWSPAARVDVRLLRGDSRGLASIAAPFGTPHAPGSGVGDGWDAAAAASARPSSSLSPPLPPPQPPALPALPEACLPPVLQRALAALRCQPTPAAGGGRWPHTKPPPTTVVASPSVSFPRPPALSPVILPAPQQRRGAERARLLEFLTQPLPPTSPRTALHLAVTVSPPQLGSTSGNVLTLSLRTSTYCIGTHPGDEGERAVGGPAVEPGCGRRHQPHAEEHLLPLLTAIRVPSRRHHLFTATATATAAAATPSYASGRDGSFIVSLCEADAAAPRVRRGSDAYVGELQASLNGRQYVLYDSGPWPTHTSGSSSGASTRSHPPSGAPPPPPPPPPLPRSSFAAALRWAGPSRTSVTPAEAAADAAAPVRASTAASPQQRPQGEPQQGDTAGGGRRLPRPHSAAVAHRSSAEGLSALLLPNPPPPRPVSNSSWAAQRACQGSSDSNSDSDAGGCGYETNEERTLGCLGGGNEEEGLEDSDEGEVAAGASLLTGRRRPPPAAGAMSPHHLAPARARSFFMPSARPPRPSPSSSLGPHAGGGGGDTAHSRSRALCGLPLTPHGECEGISSAVSHEPSAAGSGAGAASGSPVSPPRSSGTTVGLPPRVHTGPLHSGGGGKAAGEEPPRSSSKLTSGTPAAAAAAAAVAAVAAAGRHRRRGGGGGRLRRSDLIGLTSLTQRLVSLVKGGGGAWAATQAGSNAGGGSGVPRSSSSPPPRPQHVHFSVGWAAVSREASPPRAGSSRVGSAPAGPPPPPPVRRQLAVILVGTADGGGHGGAGYPARTRTGEGGSGGGVDGDAGEDACFISIPAVRPHDSDRRGAPASTPADEVRLLLPPATALVPVQWLDTAAAAAGGGGVAVARSGSGLAGRGGSGGGGLVDATRTVLSGQAVTSDARLVLLRPLSCGGGGGNGVWRQRSARPPIDRPVHPACSVGEGSDDRQAGREAGAIAPLEWAGVCACGVCGGGAAAAAAAAAGSSDSRPPPVAFPPVASGPLPPPSPQHAAPQLAAPRRLPPTLLTIRQGAPCDGGRMVTAAPVGCGGSGHAAASGADQARGAGAAAAAGPGCIHGAGAPTGREEPSQRVTAFFYHVTLSHPLSPLQAFAAAATLVAHGLGRSGALDPAELGQLQLQARGPAHACESMQLPRGPCARRGRHDAYI